MLLNSFSSNVVEQIASVYLLFYPFESMLLAGLFVRSPKFKFNSSKYLKKQAAAFSVSEQSA